MYVCVCTHVCKFLGVYLHMCIRSTCVCDIVFDIVCVFVSRRGDSEVLSN